MADALQLPETTKALTDRQEAFVAAYVGEARFNAREAAVLAGYSAESAYTDGPRLLRNAQVRARVDEHLDALSMSGAEALAELTAIARAPMDRFQQVVSEYTTKQGTTYQTVRQDLNPKVKALEIICKARGLLSSVDVNVKVETKTIIGINLSDV